ncbi:sensor histidine kinase [Streptomyces sp. NPDC052013]|uniref:sensor histidine kinase n=1 Tax=Streptomyces sp. NPDC052013 TaxID=3365679 RepID=UPI0037D98A3A
MGSTVRGGPMPGVVAVPVTLAALAAAGWAAIASWGTGPPSALWTDLAYRGFGVPLIVAGGVLWTRGSRTRVGVLLIALGLTYYLQFLRTSDHPFLFAVGFCLAFLYVGVFGHLALGLPSGRLRGAGDRVYVAVCYLACVGTQVGRYLADRPSGTWNYNIGQVNTRWAIASSLILAALGVTGIVIVLRRLLVALAVRRRRTGPVWAVMIIAGVLLIASALTSAMGLPLDLRLVVEVLMLGGSALGLAVAYLVSAGLQWRREMHIAELPARLGKLHAAPLDTLQASLAEAVGDPTLRLLLPRQGGTLTGLSGDRVDRTGDPARAITPISRGDGLLCVIEHDAALAETGRTTAIAFALTGLVMENVRLYTQVSESRQRLLEAELAERRRIERALHDGAQQGFFAVLTLLGMAHSRAVSDGSDALADLLDTTRCQLTESIAALRDLSQGLHPHSLERYGLRQTVADLARNHAGRVTYEVPDRRWPHDVESTAYFVIAEGVTNAVKHAVPDAAVRVAVTPDGDDLVVTVTDDGQGGADARGGGLRGLTERVAAAGGELRVDSPRGVGTRLVARLPGEFPAGSPDPPKGDGR